MVTSERDLYSQRMQFWLQTIPNMGSDFTPMTPDPQVSPGDTVTGSEAVGAEFAEQGNSTNGVASLGVRGLDYFAYFALRILFPALLGVLVVG